MKLETQPKKKLNICDECGKYEDQHHHFVAVTVPETCECEHSDWVADPIPDVCYSYTDDPGDGVCAICEHLKECHDGLDRQLPLFKQLDAG